MLYTKKKKKLDINNITIGQTFKQPVTYRGKKTNQKNRIVHVNMVLLIKKNKVIYLRGIKRNCSHSCGTIQPLSSKP